MARLVMKGEFVGPGEELSAAYLERTLPYGWVVICNKEIPRERSSREVDFIVVASHCIFVLEEKHWWGEIAGNEDAWILDASESFPSPLTKAQDVAKRLTAFLRERIASLNEMTAGQRYVHGRVLLSHPRVSLRIDDPRVQSQVLLLEGCHLTLTEFDGAVDRRLSIEGVRELIVRRLVELPDRPHIPRRVGNYDILEVLSAVGSALSLKARHDDGSERILRIHRRPVTLDTDALASVERALLREYTVLGRLGQTGRTPRVDPYFSWNQDEFWVFPIYPLEGVTLRADAATLLPGAARIATIFEDAFVALALVHDAGVVHRGITPDRIHLTTDHGIALSDFLVARIEGFTTVAAHVDALDPGNPYRAPECRRNPRLATEASDVFSLSASLLFWATGLEIGSGGVSATLQGARPDLNADLAKAMDRLTARCMGSNPEARPKAKQAAQMYAQVQRAPERASHTP